MSQRFDDQRLCAEFVCASLRFLLSAEEAKSSLSRATLKKHGLLPLWLRNELASSVDQVNRPDLLRLYVPYVASFHRAANLLRELSDSAPCPFWVLKGGSLMWWLYSTPSDRPISDLDLWVDSGDAPSFRQFLKLKGYKSTEKGEHNLFLRAGWCLDLHSHPYNQFEDLLGFDVAQIVLDSSSLFSESPSLKRLSPRDEFRLLLLHAVKHLFKRLVWLLDLALFFRNFSPEELMVETCSPEARFVKLTIYALDRVGIRADDRWTSFVDFQSLNYWEKRLVRLGLSGRVTDSLGMLMPLLGDLSIRVKIKYLRKNLFPEGQSLARRSRRLTSYALQLFTNERVKDLSK